jgi:uncharacterized membrane protein YhhN
LTSSEGMPKNSSTLFGLLSAVSVLLTLAGDLLSVSWLVYLCKPLATFLIISLAFTNWRIRKDAYSFWITLGLVFSLVGDVALMWSRQYFEEGLAAFLLTHIAYLMAYSRDARFPPRFRLWLVYLAFAALLYQFISRDLSSGLKISVALYAFFLLSMGAQAMNRFLILRTASARWAAIGAIFFILSDSLLSIDRYRMPIPLAPVFILVPYYLGQWLIAASTN